MSLQDPVNLGHGANRDFLLHSMLKEVNLGLRFCDIMRAGGAPPDVYATGERRAQLAVQSAEEYMWKLRIAHPDFNQLTSLVERLRFELKRLAGKQDEGR